MGNTQSCFIDGKCYAANESTNAFGKSCYICDPTVSQREWTKGPTVGATGADGNCVINGACVPAGMEYFYQHRAWNSPRVMSECRYCNPVDNVNEWSVKEGYMFNATTPIPPADCAVVETTTDTAPEEVTPDIQPSITNTSDDKDDNGLSTG